MLALRERVQRQARQSFPGVTENFDPWAESTAEAVSRAQREAVRATAGYLAALLISETGRRSRPLRIDAEKYAGVSRDGRKLAVSLRSPLIAVRAALSNDIPASEALNIGLVRAERMVGLDFDHAHRTALLEAIDSDDRFDGFQRYTRGTCAGCLAKSAEVGHGLMFQVHAGCQCVSMPIVSGVPDTFPIPTGAALFASKTEEEQDEALGPAAADAVRSGEVSLDDLVGHSEMERGPDFLTQAPLGA